MDIPLAFVVSKRRQRRPRRDRGRLRPDSTYNYRSTAEQKAAGAIWIERGELPGLSAFLRERERIFHNYSTYSRGLDQSINTYNYLDMTPLGRGADDAVPYPMAWLCYHDSYDAAEEHHCSRH